MDSKKVIAICQSGGEFVTNRDGSLSYDGGEAYAVDIDENTNLSDLKKEIAEMFNCGMDRMTIKYFLPGNKKTLITISKDKDLQRMINFLGDTTQVDVFIISEDAAARNVSIMPTSRSSRTTASEAVVPVVAPLHSFAGDTNYLVDQIYLDIVNEEPSSIVPAESDSGKHQRAAQQWENIITGVDQRFNTLSEFRDALHKYSIAHGFAYTYKKNDSHRVSVKCKSQGCPWRIYASRLATTQLICIKKMNPKHSCEGASAKAGYRATRGWVGTLIKEKLQASPNYKPKDIADDIKREYGIELNYSQAWRAKEIAREQLQGSYKEAYTQLPYFCEKIKETNPGSVALYTTKDDSSFHRLYISFHASICGFRQGCRPLLFLDSTPLNSKYQGELLAATAVDGDDGIFPVAFAVVDAETEENWRWFLMELKTTLSTDQKIVFISDFQNGLQNSVAEIFNGSFHGYCIRHLAEKLNMDLKGQFSHEARRFLINDLHAAAYAPTEEGFRCCMENITAISPEAYNWVMASEPKHWANAYFEGDRYNFMTSNFGQQFYNWVSEAHELPITQMVDVLRGKMMEMIYTRRVESNQLVTKLTPSKEEKLQKETTAARTLQMLLSHGSVFEVRGESVEAVEHVDLDQCDCSCREWKLSGLPCCHAIAVFECMGRSPYDYCAKFFTVESFQLTYAESIYPVPNIDRPAFDESTEWVMVTPPPTKRPPGRPKIKPVDSIDKIKRQLQCSKCKGLGHNKKTCKSSVDLLGDFVCSSVGHVPSMKEDARDYEELKGKAEETKEKVTETARAVERASGSWTQWAKDKISNRLGLKHAEPKLQDTTKKSTNLATDAAKKATEQMQDVASEAGQYAAGKAKEMKDAAADKIKEMKDAAAGKASEIADGAKEQARYTKHVASDKACQTAECMKEKAGEAASKAKETVGDAASTLKEWGTAVKDQAAETASKQAGKTRETVNETKEKTAHSAQEAKEGAAEKANEAMEGAKEIGQKGAEKGKKEQTETKEQLSWAQEKAKESYDAAKGKLGETLEGVKDTISSNYESAKQKLKEKATGRGRDEEL